jgi:hypothetical protein
MLPGDLAYLADRFAVLAEVAAIERDLAALEQRDGRLAGSADIRRRLLAVSATVCEQVCALQWRALGQTTPDLMTH